VAKILLSLQKATAILVGGIRHDPVVLILYILSFFTGTKPVTLKALSQADLLLALGAGKSLIRFGDGEVMIATGRSIRFQTYSKELAYGLKHIIADYRNDSPYVVGSLLQELQESDAVLRAKNRLRVWRLLRIFVRLRFNLEPAYFSAVLFYHKNVFKRDIAPLFRDRHIICVTRAGTMNAPFRRYMETQFREASFIVSPDKNAFAVKDRLMSEIDTAIAEHPSLKPVLVLAAGPASKIITYIYATRGVQALDIGHGIEIIASDADYSDRI